MEIDETTNKWFEQLDTKLNRIQNKDAVWNHCSLVTSIVKDYSIVILQLLKQNKNIPAMVLLRSMAEIIIKTCWCIKEAEGNIEVYYDKNQRLTKTSLSEQKKQTKRANECFNDPIIAAGLQILNDSLSQMTHVKCAPDNIGLCKELFGNDAHNLFYDILFGQFHQVVHANLNWLQKLKISERGEIYQEGYERDIFQKICKGCVYLLLEYIYKYYGFDYSNIKSEHERFQNL